MVYKRKLRDCNKIYIAPYLPLENEYTDDQPVKSLNQELASLEIETILSEEGDRPSSHETVIQVK